MCTPFTEPRNEEYLLFFKKIDIGRVCTNVSHQPNANDTHSTQLQKAQRRRSTKHHIKTESERPSAAFQTTNKRRETATQTHTKIDRFLDTNKRKENRM